MITGDDILIEYVTRLMKMFSTNKIREEELSNEQQSKIEKFITHYVCSRQEWEERETQGVKRRLSLRTRAVSRHASRTD